MNRRGVSGVVTTFLLVMLTIFLVAIVFVAIREGIGDVTEGSKKCFGNYGKVEFQREYTCYDYFNNEVQISIRLGDIEIESLSVLILSEDDSEDFTLMSEGVSFPRLRNYGEEKNNAGLVKLPGKKAGATYLYDWDFGASGEVTEIKLVPIIAGKKCGVSDSFKGLEKCVP